jgi:hypothetical protein
MKLFDWLDNLEIAVLALVAALLLLLGPWFIILRLGRAHLPGPALLTGALWLACVIVFVRDVRRTRLSWISVGVLMAWLVTTVLVGLLAE